MKSTNNKVIKYVIGYAIFAIMLGVLAASLSSCKSNKMVSCIQPTNYKVMKQKSKEIAKKDCLVKVIKSKHPKYN